MSQVPTGGKYLKAKEGPQLIEGSWSLRFIKGKPELPETTEISELGSWTHFDDDAAKKFSGTALYSITFNKPEGEI